MWLKSLLLFQSMFASMIIVHGQGASLFHCIVGVENMTDESQRKVLSEVLVAWDPDGTFHISQELQQVDMVIHGTTTRAQFHAHLAASGFGVTFWEPLLPPKGIALNKVGYPGFPKYIETGDRAADDARYDIAKNEWITAHPLEYEQVIAQPK